MMITVALQFVTAVLIGLALVLIIRWIGRRSAAAAAIVAAGVLARAGLGVALFWISYEDLPIAATLHDGGGFWTLASDARVYYGAAVDAVNWGFGSIQSPSARYARALAFWVHLVGASPAAGLYLNVVLFIVSAALVSAAFPVANDTRRDWPLLFCLAALSFNPSLVVHATQPLKDTFMASAIVAGCAGAYLVLRGLQSSLAPLATVRTLSIGFACLAIGFYAATGVRPYFGFVFWAAYLVGSAVVCASAARHRLRALTVSAAALAMLWSLLALGAPSYYQEIMRRTVGRSDSLSSLIANAIRLLAEAQAGFVNTPAGTNAAAGFAEGEPEFGIAVASGRWTLAKGLALNTIPVPLAERLSLFRIKGGRGLLAFADLDTLFLDATIIVFLIICATSRSSIAANLPYFVFSVFLSFVAALLVAYVVTNLGTALRLRLMFAVPLWMAAAGLVPRATRAT
jgi:hypothetical protein